MARVATVLLASVLTPMLDTGVYNIGRKQAIANGLANSGDYIPLTTIQRAGRGIGAKLNVDATLGASCTVQLAQYRSGALVQNLTAATTAGGASIVSGSALANPDFLAGDEIVLVVGGANIGAGANATFDVHLQH